MEVFTNKLIYSKSKEYFLMKLGIERVLENISNNLPPVPALTIQLKEFDKQSTNIVIQI